MTSFLHAIADRWIQRSAKPDAQAIAAVSGLKPAIVITGASRGIGLALAERFAAKADAVVLIARHPGPLAAAAERIKSASPATIVVPLALDITDARAFDQIGLTLSAHGLYLDVLINNAGMGLGGDFCDHPVADIDKLLALNVGALTRLTRLALPQMRARGRGGILNVASMGGFVPGPYQAAYYASKAYVLSLTEAVAPECAGSGVRIAVLAPGPVETQFHAAMGAEHARYRSVLPSLSTATIAAAARRQFILGRRVITPGLLYLVGGPFLRALPHTISVPIMAWLLKPPPR